MTQIKVAAIQMKADESLSSNVQRTIEKVKQAAADGAQIICLQELFASRYFCQTEEHKNFELAESIPGPLTDAFCKLASELNIVVVLPLFERRTAGVFHNSAVVIETDGTIVGKYRKMHIPDDPNFLEKFYFTPGDLGFRTFETSLCKIGVCICWDQWFPEAARLTALSGAEIIVYPTAIGWLEEDKADFGESQLASWQTMMRSHAIANGVFVVAPNRVGTEDNIQFWGSSFIADPYGNMLAEAARDEEQTLIEELDLTAMETARTHWPFLRDRRIDAYAGLNKRFLDSDE